MRSIIWVRILALLVATISSYGYAVEPEIPIEQLWRHGSFISNQRLGRFTWTVANTVYFGFETQKKLLGTVKISIEKTVRHGYLQKIGMMKIKWNNQIVLEEFSISADDQPKIYKFKRNSILSGDFRLAVKYDHDNFLVSKIPIKEERGGGYLDFQARATEPSRRNVILQSFLDGQEAVRIGHIPNQAHSLDYIPGRCSPVLAMASAIATWKFEPKD